MTSGSVKLTDFGMAKVNIEQYDQGTNTFCGSHGYLAPEMIKRKGHGKALDWYMLGVLLYETLVGMPPYWSGGENAEEEILKGKLKMPK